MSIDWKTKYGGLFEGNIPQFSISLEDRNIDVEFYGLNHGDGVFENKAWIKPEDFAVILRKLNVVDEDFIEDMLFYTEYLDLKTLAGSIFGLHIDIGRYPLPLERISNAGEELEYSKYDKVENRLKTALDMINRFEPYIDECKIIYRAWEYLSKESELANEYLKKKKMEDDKKHKKEIGYIYLIIAENGLCKIGKTKDIEKRMNIFTVKFPLKWELRHYFQAQDYTFAEKELHKMFSDKRDVGEWFRLDENDVDYISSIKDFSI